MSEVVIEGEVCFVLKIHYILEFKIRKEKYLTDYSLT